MIKVSSAAAADELGVGDMVGVDSCLYMCLFLTFLQVAKSLTGNFLEEQPRSSS